jgi:hypothetical protein
MKLMLKYFNKLKYPNKSKHFNKLKHPNKLKHFNKLIWLKIKTI